MARSLGWYRAEQIVLKITLDGSEPAIWRRAEVHSGLTLDDLHHVIQGLFGWTNSHMHHFLVPPKGELTDDALGQAKRYHAMPRELVWEDVPSG